MNKQQLIDNIKRKQSFLCVGLDTDLEKIPVHLKNLSDPIFEFNKQIIDATQQYCIAYKPNTAFYECLGVKGWQSLEKTVHYIKDKYPDQFIIADAKRGDIGNTSLMYAKAFLEVMPCDAITVAPYMGKDSVTPFLSYKDKWAIVLGLTSNEGAADFQKIPIPFFKNEDKIEVQLLAEVVLRKVASWGTTVNLMFVIGATQEKLLKEIRKVVPDHFFLVPGIGAQGGSLAEVAENGMNKDVGLIVNASRSIIYAGNGLDFAEKAVLEAQSIQQEMAKLLIHKKIL